MASISEMLSDLSDFPENHPFLTEALPTIAGAVLMARRGRNGQPTTIGAPLGAGLLAGGQLLGDYAKDQTDRRNKTAQGKVIGQLNPSTTNLPTIKGATTGKEPDYASWLSSYVAAGGDPATGAKLWQDANKTEKGTYVYWKAPGKPEVALPAGAPAPGPDYYTSSFKPSDAKATEQEKLDFYKKERQIAAGFKTPPKTPAQMAADAEARTTGTFAALSKLPVVRWNPGVALLTNDDSMKLLPNGTEGDIASGRAIPVLKSDMKQLRQAQTAKVTLDDLEKTIDSALPKNAGAVSASGMLGRKVTEIVNPAKLARFNAARFGAADAFVRALTQRGNKSQFDAAMNNIVGPNATVQSARAGIDQAKQIISDMTTELTGRAGANLTATPLGMVPPPEPEVPEEDVAPPPGYEE